MKLTTIATPFPRTILKRKLEKLFPKEIITECPNDEGFETCMMFNLTQEQHEMILENIGDVLVWESEEANKLELV
jgi:hypothetical protein